MHIILRGEKKWKLIKKISQNLNIADVIKIMNSCQEIGKDSITLLDHISIIQKYTKNEYLDREQAIDIYKKFNMDNIDYLLGLNIYLLLNPNKCANLELSSNEVIIENLSLQLLYFCFKKTITYFGKFQFAKKFMNF